LVYIAHRLTDEEIRSVVGAVGYTGGGWTGRGSWFTCPNGHPYVITECGGAMEEASCYECGARIGGTSHTLRGDNMVAEDLLRRAGV
jgi:hypothetical protein